MILHILNQSQKTRTDLLKCVLSSLGLQLRPRCIVESYISRYSIDELLLRQVWTHGSKSVMSIDFLTCSFRNQFQSWFLDGCGFYKVDMCACHFVSSRLTDTELIHVNLARSVTAATSITNSRYKRCNLSRSQWLNTACTDSVFSQSHMEEMCSFDVKWRRVVVEDSTMEHSHFARCFIEKCAFIGSDLTAASLCDVNLVSSRLSNCVLSDMVLNRCSFSQVDFGAVRLSGVQIKNSTIVSSSFEGATFSKLYFENVAFDKVRLRGIVVKGVSCIFNRCFFKLADFAYGDLSHCHFNDCRFEKCDFLETNLTGCCFNFYYASRKEIQCAFYRTRFIKANLTSTRFYGDGFTSDLDGPGKIFSLSDFEGATLDRALYFPGHSFSQYLLSEDQRIG